MDSAAPPLARAAPPSGARRWGRSVLFLGVVAAWALAPFSFCPLRFWFHVPCPGCGATRAVLRALHGDFAGSYRLHPLAIPAAILGALTVAAIARSIARDAPGELPRALRTAWMVMAIALLAVWIARFVAAFGGPTPV